MRPDPFRVAVIGGGISGFAAAHRLEELSREKNIPLEIKLFEASHHLGGVISTRRQDGFLMEGGPDSFISEKPWALDLCRRLGLESEIIGTNEQCRKSFVVRKGKLLPVPEGFYLMAPLRLGAFLASGIFSWGGKLRMALELAIPRGGDGRDESVAHFIRRRFGNEALVRMGQAMIAGIYTSDPDSLSLRATFPKFLELEEKYGSVIRGLRNKFRNPQSAIRIRQASGPRYSLFLTLRGGMQTLVDAIVARLPEKAVEMDSPVRSLEQSHSGWRIDNRFEADSVVIALTASKSAELVGGFDSELAGELAQIPYASVATVNLAYRRSDIPHPLDGFGFVVPACEKLSMVGCSFSSVKFPGRAPEGSVLIRAFVGGDLKPEVMEWNHSQMEAAIQRDLAKLLGARAAPLFVSIDRHANSMPQYHVGHLDRVARIESLTEGHPGLYLAGNGLRGIGIPDCVHQGEEAAEKLCHFIQSQQPKS